MKSWYLWIDIQITNGIKYCYCFFCLLIKKSLFICKQNIRIKLLIFSLHWNIFYTLKKNFNFANISKNKDSEKKDTSSDKETEEKSDDKEDSSDKNTDKSDNKEKDAEEKNEEEEKKGKYILPWFKDC